MRLSHKEALYQVNFTFTFNVPLCRIEHKMRTIVTGVPVAWCVCLCLAIVRLRCAKMSQRIEVLFGAETDSW